MDKEALVEARRAARPGEQLADTWWLDMIRNGELPFPLKEIHIA